MVTTALDIPLSFQLSCFSFLFFFTSFPKNPCSRSTVWSFILSPCGLKHCKQFLVFSNTNHLQMNKKGTRTEREQGQKAGKRKDKKDMICTFFYGQNTERLGASPTSQTDSGILVSSLYTQAQNENWLSMFKHVLLSTRSLKTCTDVCIDKTQRPLYSI